VGHRTLIKETKHKYIQMQSYLALWYCLPSSVPKMEKYKGVNITPWKLAVSKTLVIFSISAFLNTMIKKKNPESK